MKHFLLLGNHTINAGPANVNRSFIENSDACLVYIKSHNRLFRRFERTLKCIFCNAIVFSAAYSLLELMIAKLLRKRIVYIMHGCCKYENNINRLELSQKDLRHEQRMLKYSDKIVAVSEKYAQWVRHEFPIYANKVTFINNSLEINKQYKKHIGYSDNKFIIAVTGGNRPIKCNLEVCKAAEKLNSRNYNIEVCVFGDFYKNGENILCYPFVKAMGHLNKNDYYEKLQNADLMVVNSEVESFGLVVGDALNCGCSLLMSKNVGALSIFEKLSAEDIVEDNHNIDELTSKIEYLLRHGNAEKLYESVDKEKCSGRQAYLNLKKICINE